MTSAVSDHRDRERVGEAPRLVVVGAVWLADADHRAGCRGDLFDGPLRARTLSDGLGRGGLLLVGGCFGEEVVEVAGEVPLQ